MRSIVDALGISGARMPRGTDCTRRGLVPSQALSEARAQPKGHTGLPHFGLYLAESSVTGRESTSRI